ncbi:MAG: divalent-cation tolerance protein CutA [Pseudomonadota bacterium]
MSSMFETDSSLRLVLTTVSDEQAARTLANDAIEQRLAACAQLGPAVESIYPWQGRIESQTEVVLTLKTTTARLSALKQRVLERHPYDLPELIVLPVIETTAAYLNWARDWVEGDATVTSTKEPL